MAAVTLTQVKDYLRYDAVDTSQDDNFDDIVLPAAQRWVENYTGHLLVQREVSENIKAFPVVRVTGESPYFDLRWKPYVADSLTVGYLDADLALDETFDAFTIYAYEGTHRVIPNVEWPGEFQGISFTYTAGYATVDAIPDDLLHAVCIYAAMADVERAEMSSAGWMALENILTHYRMPVLA